MTFICFPGSPGNLFVFRRFFGILFFSATGGTLTEKKLPDLSFLKDSFPASLPEVHIRVLFGLVKDFFINDLIDRPIPGRFDKLRFMHFCEIALLFQTEIETCIFRLSFCINDFMRDGIDAVEQPLGFDIAGEILLYVFLKNKGLNKGGQHGTDRHADDHSGNAEKTASDQDGDEDHKA